MVQPSACMDEQQAVGRAQQPWGTSQLSQKVERQPLVGGRPVHLPKKVAVKCGAAGWTKQTTGD